MRRAPTASPFALKEPADVESSSVPRSTRTSSAKPSRRRAASPRRTGRVRSRRLQAQPAARAAQADLVAVAAHSRLRARPRAQERGQAGRRARCRSRRSRSTTSIARVACGRILKPRLPDLLDRPVIRLPELIKPGPIPEPDPIGPIAGLAGRLDRVALNPQPLPPRDREWRRAARWPGSASVQSAAGAAALVGRLRSAAGSAVSGCRARVGELKTLSESVASRLDDLTITSRIAPWLIWPRCFYSKAVVCKTTTDCDGRFTCCFWWWPWHVRNGRLRFDSRPDIIIKVTQVIGGSSRVIYLDPYTSTRWDSWGAYIDLLLDDEDIVCGTGCSPNPDGPAALLRPRRQRRGLQDQPGDRPVRRNAVRRGVQQHGLRQQPEPPRRVRRRAVDGGAAVLLSAVDCGADHRRRVQGHQDQAHGHAREQSHARQRRPRSRPVHGRDDGQPVQGPRHRHLPLVQPGLDRHLVHRLGRRPRHLCAR